MIDIAQLGVIMLFIIRRETDKGSRGGACGESTRLPSVCGSGLNPGVNAVSGLSLLLVFFFVPRGFSPSCPDFPSTQKLAFPPDFTSTRNGRQRTAM